MLILKVNEFFESQNSYDLLDKSDIFHRLQKTLSEKKSLSQDNFNLRARINRLESIITEMRQGNLDIDVEQLLAQRKQDFGKSSERSTKEEIAASHNEDLIIPGADDPGKRPKTPRILKPSLRYPKAEVRETRITPETPPSCPCCSQEMQNSGMTEESEKLTVIPKKIIIDRIIRDKFRCSHCQGAVTTAALPPSLVPGGAYSDALIVDVAVSKYCDLMPIQRYIRAAERMGIIGLPSQSLIEGTHSLAQRLRAVYRLLKQEILLSKILHADETPHRMLEGDERENWFFWGFVSQTAAYFEAHDTRSGDVASEILKLSLCEFLVSDVYSGYGKAVRQTNEYRLSQHLPLIACVYCNAHARRYLKKAQDVFADEAKFFLDRYRAIYFLESQLTTLRARDPDLPTEKILEIRGKMRVFYEEMKHRAEVEQFTYSDKSSIVKAMVYFLKNYEGLTLFLNHAELPIDNNPAERILRNPVIGRKTWYGTHSPQGADTAAVLFSIIESCKLNQVNPTAYLNQLVQALHAGEKLFTPYSFATRAELRG